MSKIVICTLVNMDLQLAGSYIFFNGKISEHINIDFARCERFINVHLYRLKRENTIACSLCF